MVSVFTDPKIALGTPPQRVWRLDVVVGSEVLDVIFVKGCWAICALPKWLQLEPEIQGQPIITV